ncbi:MAG: TonB-dependent receptor [Gammaproteobacteria bacterium]|nr:TonB-dependent receptor [Gammaproteobacteria bacterium]
MRSVNPFVRRAVSCVIGAMAVTMALPAVADDTGLEEVVVTARKREENLQDVSMSITAIPATEIERLGLSDVEDVARLDASLIYDKGYSATDNRISIRGLSPTRGRVNVAVLVDGIDTSSESIGFGGGSLLATSRLLDLQAVEIVKGPQSALYGRSAFAGAVQYVTKDPSRVSEGSIRGSYGDYGRYDLAGSWSGPVSDDFGLRINGVYWNQDGIHKNQITGRKVGDGDGWGLALTGKWQIADDASMKLRVEYADDHFGAFPTAQLPVNSIDARPTAGSQCLTVGTGAAVAPVAGRCPTNSFRVYSPTSTFGVFPGSNHVYSSFGLVPSADKLAVRLDPNPATGKDYEGSDRSVFRVSAVFNRDLAAGTFTSLTGYTEAKFSFLEDGDFDSGVQPNGTDRALRSTRFDYDNSTTQFSQEFRYRSDFDGPANFMAGYLYWQENAKQDTRSINIICLPALPPNTFFPGQPAIAPSCGTRTPNEVMALMQPITRLNSRKIEHNSLFGMVEYQVTDAFKATFEGRYASETEEIQGVSCSPTLDAAAGPPGTPVTKCADPSFPGFQVFGPSVNYLYPFFNPFAPPGTPGSGVRQAPGVPVSLSSEHSYFAPRVTLEYRASDAALIYLTWAKGVKPGGFSTVTAGSWQDADFDGAYDEFSFKDEKIQEYELGAKFQSADARLRFNPSLFFIKYDDKQVGAQLITPSGIAVGRLLNAGKAEVKGLELDAQWAPTDGLLFGLNYSYLDTEFTDFPFTSTSSTDAVRVGGCERKFDTANNAKLCFLNLKGRELERAPRHSAVGIARWSMPVGGGASRFFIEGDVQYQSKRYIDFYNRVQLDSYTHGNLRVGVTNDRWEVIVYADNITDDDTVMTGNANPGDVAQSIADPSNFSPANTIGVTMPDPRIVGIRFGYRFGGN